MSLLNKEASYTLLFLIKTQYTPHFVVNFLILEDFQSSDLIKYFWFVKTHQVVDNHIGCPNMLIKE